MFTKSTADSQDCVLNKSFFLDPLTHSVVFHCQKIESSEQEPERLRACYVRSLLRSLKALLSHCQDSRRFFKVHWQQHSAYLYYFLDSSICCLCFVSNCLRDSSVVYLPPNCTLPYTLISCPYANFDSISWPSTARPSYLKSMGCLNRPFFFPQLSNLVWLQSCHPLCQRYHSVAAIVSNYFHHQTICQRLVIYSRMSSLPCYPWSSFIGFCLPFVCVEVHFYSLLDRYSC